MKRIDLIRHVERQGRELETSAVPRHSEINEFLARKICDDLHVAEP